jgi:hypothetical protein
MNFTPIYRGFLAQNPAEKFQRGFFIEDRGFFIEGKTRLDLSGLATLNFFSL